MTYLELKKRHADEIAAFPMFFAFNDAQFADGMKTLGVTEIGELCRIPGGGFIRKTDAALLGDVMLRQAREMDAARSNDEFLINALVYELGNHEYGYTGNPEPAFEAVGLDVNAIDDRVRRCFNVAKARFYEGGETV